MKPKLFLVSVAALAMFGAGAAIGWAATNGPGHGTTPAGTTSKAMHGAKDVRAHMRAMHPDLDKTALDRIVADCQQRSDDETMMGDMHDGEMMGRGLHDPGDSPHDGMMDDGMMG